MSVKFVPEDEMDWHPGGGWKCTDCDAYVRVDEAERCVPRGNWHYAGCKQVPPKRSRPIVVEISGIPLMAV